MRPMRVTSSARAVSRARIRSLALLALLALLAGTVALYVLRRRLLGPGWDRPVRLGLGGRADLHDGDAAGELGEALLELLAVEVRVGVLDLDLDLVDAALDGLAVAGAVDERGRVLGDHDAAGAAELRDLRVLELEAHLLGDGLAAGEDRDVLEHALAAVAEARRLDGHARERAAQLVDDERGERPALAALGAD